MRKLLLIAAGVLTLFMCSCKTKEQETMKSSSEKETKTPAEVSITNSVKDADVWILPQTEENLKTTVWGTPTLSKLGGGESRSIGLDDPGDDGQYIFRMIDTDSFYYSANGIVLETGWSAEIKGNDLKAELVVSDENGTEQNTYDVFCARL